VCLEARADNRRCGRSPGSGSLNRKLRLLVTLDQVAIVEGWRARRPPGAMLRSALAARRAASPPAAGAPPRRAFARRIVSIRTITGVAGASSARGVGDEVARRRTSRRCRASSRVPIGSERALPMSNGKQSSGGAGQRGGARGERQPGSRRATSKERRCRVISPSWRTRPPPASAVVKRTSETKTSETRPLRPNL